MISFISCVKENQIADVNIGNGDLVVSNRSACPTGVDLQLSWAAPIPPSTCSNVKVTLNGLENNTMGCKITKATFTYKKLATIFDTWTPALNEHLYVLNTRTDITNFQFNLAGGLGNIGHNVNTDVLGDGDNFIIITNNSAGFIEVCVKVEIDCPGCSPITVCKQFQISCT